MTEYEYIFYIDFSMCFENLYFPRVVIEAGV